MIFFLALRGLNLTCDDIMFCICRVNGGLKTESNIPGVYRELSWSWRCGGESRNPQKHTQSMSRQMQRDTFLVQQTCQTKCVRSSSEIEVNDILLLVLSWISCWIIFFYFFYFFLPLWWWRRKQVTASVSPFVSAWCDNTGIRRCNTFREHDFSFFTFLLPKVPRPIVLLLVIGRWYKIQFLSQLRKHMSVCFIHKYDWHFK